MKKILVLVSGLSPQILTESLYALAVTSQPTFVPDEIHLITTSEGAERARLLLLSESPGWFYRLCREYGVPASCFNMARIHVMRDTSGNKMADIRTPQDNAAAADYIISVVRALTAESDSVIHASIAGGRKTMGFYMGYAMSLFGRAQDELSHVLVEEPYESLQNFFFPTHQKEIIYSRDGKPLDASQAKVWLASIPFVRMRQGIPDALKRGSFSFSEVVAAASQALIAPSLQLDSEHLRLITPIGIVQLPPADFAFYLWIAKQTVSDSDGVPSPADGVANHGYGKAVVDIYRRINSVGLKGHDRTEEVLDRGMQKNYFEQRKSRINKAIRLALGVNGSPYEIMRRGRPGYYRFGIFLLTPEQIRWHS